MSFRGAIPDDSHDELRRLLGGYLLGGLDEADTERLDSHLATCDECRVELDRLAPVPELLRAYPQAPPLAIAPGTRPEAARVEALLATMRSERTREKRGALTRRLAVAAVVLAVAAASGALVLGHETAPEPPSAGPGISGSGPGASPGAGSSPGADGQASGAPASGQPQVTGVFEAADGSGMSGQAVLTGKTWGVEVSLAVQKLAGDGPFACEVGNDDGHTEQAAMWGPTPSGNARVTGASSIQLTSVRTISVTDATGHTLGTVHVN
jgi:anti-sigma factor RsiW